MHNRFLVTVLLTVSVAPALAAQPPAAEPHRLLVVPAGGANVRAELSRDAVAVVTRALAQAGRAVIDPEQSLRLADQQEQTLQPFLGVRRTGDGPEQKLCQAACADLLLRIGVTVAREVKQQGRYVVADALHVRLLGAEDAQVLLDQELEAKGSSLEGYAAAHKSALQELTDPRRADSLVALVTKRIDALRADEAANGTPFTVGVLTEREDPAFVAAFSDGLGKLDNVVTGSVNQVRATTAAGEGGAKRAAAELTLRYRGNLAALKAGVWDMLAKTAARNATEDGSRLEPSFLASRRRLDVIVRTTKPQTTLGKEVERIVQASMRTLCETNADYLKDKKVAVLPTAIPAANQAKAEMDSYVRAYWGEHDRVQGLQARADGKDTKEPAALDVGPVAVQGAEFPTLRAAKSKAEELVTKYHLSRPGQLATQIARLVGVALVAASDRKVDVVIDEHEQGTALDVIKREAELYREEGAVDPASIAFLQRSGAQAVVMSSLSEVLKTYQMSFTVVDLKSGQALRHTVMLPDGFKKELDEELK